MSKSFGQAFSIKKRRNNAKHLKKGKRKVTRRQLIDQELTDLKTRIESGIDASQINEFADFPISKNTLNGLKKAKYVQPTDVQKRAISLALQGKDVLGAAKTGSGKTLAFLVPILEMLYREKVSSAFGMAALIITPTRELAFQIFEVLNQIRVFHDFTANLIIGGKKMWREENLMANTNIVVCTVGRLLHHLDQTPSFNADDLQILVLDEADRIMDSKFAKDMDHIISHLPPKRQTLMFSATQTKSVKALARLSLKDPSYVSVHEHAQHATPSSLQQSYIVCELHEKLSLLYSFLKNHPNNKIIVFLQTCKQVRYVHAVMKRERPGMSVLALYGGLNQLRRIDIYRDFCRKQHVILFATDIACRGLDFPQVNWVVQLDSPVDVDTYIHRAGRTARFERNGQALLVLMPSEEELMVEALKRRKIPIEKISVNMKKMQDITGSNTVACGSCDETKEMAERAFRTYLYSLHVMKNSPIDKLDLQKFALSLGLFMTPKLRFLKNRKKVEAVVEQEENNEDEDEDDSDMILQPQTEHSVKMEEQPMAEDKEEDDEEEDDGEEKEDDGEEKEGEEKEGEERRRSKKKKPLTKAALVKRVHGNALTTRVVFDEDGVVIRDKYKRQLEDNKDNKRGINVPVAFKRLRLEDVVDIQTERSRVKEKHREERIKRKEKKRAGQQQRRAEVEDDDDDEGAVLEGVDDDDDPFQYIPDPDKLAARDDDESDDEDDDQNHAKDDSDDDDNEDEDDDSGEGDDNEDEDDDSGEGDDNDESSDDDSDDEDQNHRRSLEDAALQMVKSSRLKK